MAFQGALCFGNFSGGDCYSAPPHSPGKPCCKHELLAELCRLLMRTKKAVLSSLPLPIPTLRAAKASLWCYASRQEINMQLYCDCWCPSASCTEFPSGKYGNFMFYLVGEEMDAHVLIFVATDLQKQRCRLLLSLSTGRVP